MSCIPFSPLFALQQDGASGVGWRVDAHSEVEFVGDLAGKAEADAVSAFFGGEEGYENAIQKGGGIEVLIGLSLMLLILPVLGLS